MAKLGWILGGGLSLLALACDAADEPSVDGPGATGASQGTDTGNPGIDHGHSGGEGGLAGTFGCEEVGRAPLDWDAPSSAGFAPQDVWALVEGEHAFPVRWEAQGGVTSGAFEGTETLMHVRVSRADDAGAEWVDLEPAAPDEWGGSEEALNLGGLDGELYAACEDRLELPVRVQVSTDDGALDEEFGAALESTHGLSASWATSIDLDSLAGALEVVLGEAVREGSELQPLALSMTHGSYAIQGQLSASFEGNDGQVAWHGAGTLARWPEGGGCPQGVAVAADAKVFDFSAADVLTALSEHYPEALTFQGEAPTDLSFALAFAQDGLVCAQPSGERSLEVPVVLTWQSADERVDGTLPLTLRAKPDDAGALATAVLVRDGYLGTTVAPGEFAAAFGISGVELMGYDVAALEWGWDVDFAAGTAAGSMAVLGGTVDPCVNAPPEVIEGAEGGGSPGCRGTDYVEVARATF